MRWKLLAAALTIAVFGIGVTLWNDRPSSQDAETLLTGSFESRRNDFRTVEAMILASDLIVKAEFISEKAETVRPINPASGASTSVREDLLRSYRITETIKGSEQPGTEIVVWNTTSYTSSVLQDGSRTYEMLPAEPGKAYVLFLDDYLREDTPVWGQAGEPKQAEVVGDALVFQTTNRYRTHLAQLGVQIPPGKAAPFELTLPQLRQMADLHPTPTPGITVIPGTPRPSETMTP